MFLLGLDSILAPG